MIRWELPAPARIGEVVLAGARRRARSGAFTAVASRDLGRAEAFAARHGPLPFGREDGVAQARALEALPRSAREREAVAA